MTAMAETTFARGWRSTANLKENRMPFDYTSLNPGDCIIYDQAVPVRDGTLGLVVRVFETGIDAFILSRTGPFYADSIAHETDPRLDQESDMRQRMIRRGVFRVPPTSALLAEFRQDREEMMNRMSALSTRVSIIEKTGRALRRQFNEAIGAVSGTAAPTETEVEATEP
jgi:hypothetical protein